VYQMYPIYRNGVTITREEHAVILEHRRACLEAASAKAGWGNPLPIPWRLGYRAYWKPLGRDRTGNLRLEVSVYAPTLTRPYKRRYRLVRAQPLPASLYLG
jgi:hypothetical protein